MAEKVARASLSEANTIFSEPDVVRDLPVRADLLFTKTALRFP